ncbi:MAG TPA: VWA domain-containing protein [Thermoleophilaceae bacterium]
MSEAAALGAGVIGKLAELAAHMRAAGVRVGVDELLVAHRALAAVDPSSRLDSYNALRAVLCARHADIDAFDAAFLACFGSPFDDDRLDLTPADLKAAGIALPRMAVPGDEPARQQAIDQKPLPAAWSDVEILREKDFAEYTESERELARRLIVRLAHRRPTRESRRLRRARGRGEHHDLRRTIEASLRYGGEPMERRWREPSRKPRPVVLVCDVSGSMQAHARMLLQYMHACVAARGRVEAFVFGTRLTRVTRELAGRDHDAAMTRATHAAGDMSGGTRIGEALATLNREHGRRIGRGAVVVILSDGWDRGEPEQLAEEMSRLSRCAHRLVWLNPLKAHAGYEPLTRGMQAAMPYVDHFLAGNSIASLEQLADLLEGEMS